MKGGPENSKDYVEINFQVKYTDDEDKPVQAQLDIPVDKKMANTLAEEGKNDGREIDIYDE